MCIENIEKLTGCNVHFQLYADRPLTRIIQSLYHAPAGHYIHLEGAVLFELIDH